MKGIFPSVEIWVSTDGEVYLTEFRYGCPGVSTYMPKSGGAFVDYSPSFLLVAHNDFSQRRGCGSNDFPLLPLSKERSITKERAIGVDGETATQFRVQRFENQEGVLADADTVLPFKLASLPHHFGCGTTFVEVDIYLVGLPLADEGVRLGSTAEEP